MVEHFKCRKHNGEQSASHDKVIVITDADTEYENITQVEANKCTKLRQAEKSTCKDEKVTTPKQLQNNSPVVNSIVSFKKSVKKAMLIVSCEENELRGPYEAMDEMDNFSLDLLLNSVINILLCPEIIHAR